MVTKKVSRPKAWEIVPRDVKKLLSSSAHDGRSTQGKRDKAILATLARTGIRRKELCTLNIADCDLDAHMLRVTAAKKGKDRVIALSQDTVDALRIYLKTRNGQPGDPLFVTLGKHGPWQPRRLRPDVVTGIVIRALRRAGVTTNGNEKITAHSFRHSFATHLLRRGAHLVTVRDLLGHRNLQSTNVYVHSNPALMKEAVKGLPY